MAKRRELAITFDGSYDGFLCVVYAYYYDGIAPLCIQPEDEYQQTLAEEEFFIATDFAKAKKVLQAVREKVSPEAENLLYYTSLAEGNERFMDMFRYTRLGFRVGSEVDNHMQQDFVMGVHKRARYVGREAHLLSGFCRFAETKQGVFYCEITPMNDVLPILAEHFADRMMNQAWIVHDKKRHRAAVYDGNEYLIGDVPQEVRVEYSDDEEKVQGLWRAFFSAVTIKERVNKVLHRSNMPLHFRRNMVEFK